MFKAKEARSSLSALLASLFSDQLNLVKGEIGGVRELFSEVLQLQLQHSSENTPAMARRGDLIRNRIPAVLREWPAAQASAVLPFKGRLNVQGRDGTGLKTFVPWVRIHSPELSPSAQNGWYVVYLFRPDGTGVALCISHGSTRFDGGDFKPRSLAEASALMDWGRGLLGSEANALGFGQGIDLASGERLAKAYERTTAFSKFYARGDLPSDAELALDAEKAVSLLGQLYRAVELGRAPEAEPPEVAEAVASINAIARPSQEPTASTGQGFGLTAVERRLVENHAMALAHGWLIDNGFRNVRDVHANHSCDYLAHRNGVEHYVEVKGTTAGLGKVLLTANEVALHKGQHPQNILIVVHNVDLLEMRTKAEGGQVRAFEAWDINGAQLTPLSYSCQLTV